MEGPGDLVLLDGDLDCLVGIVRLHAADLDDRWLCPPRVLSGRQAGQCFRLSGYSDARLTTHQTWRVSNIKISTPPVARF